MIFGGSYAVDVEHVPASTEFGGTYLVEHEFVITQGRTTFGNVFRVVIDPALIPSGITEFGGTSRILGTHSASSTEFGGSYPLEQTDTYTTFIWDGWDWIPSRQRVRTDTTWKAA